eukprot:CAMPEP_0172557830 /NCGR_PEP_ID=MMETSP1067-20121228/75579_1 /TAXON_ID=265564 ORGANISM="Thalassiosira punctigera, Strain Tpunct2005C2" /NCGR_SAMPLE_ID=MMETSP1067 /ASSEMBLY_ACC=CAM_ASM_000444 /LENGTH=402 /DNA_ID=CAMNT_0013347023 /DNA_START=80 /DNA_END=1288 /DNA_ORIENTATION=+
MAGPRSTEQTPLMSDRAADNSFNGPSAPTAMVLSTNTKRGNDSRSTHNKSPTKRIGARLHQRGEVPMESGDVLAVTSKTRQRKNVGKFRRKRQDYATWKGRIGVHVEYDEFDLKQIVNIIFQTLPTEWELIDCYDVIRLWLPVESHLFSQGEEDAPAGGGGYAEGDGQIHASMPEVFVFGFGAVVFWNFKDEDSEKQWMEQHLFPRKEVLGLRHNAESIESACDEMGLCYGEAFKWHRDVVHLQTRDAGEKLAVSFAVAKSANLSIYEWRMEQAIRRNAHIPEDLAKHGQLHLNRKQINVEVGRLYLLNNAINLETNMLDTPEEFWEDDRFQPEYDTSIKYLDVNARINLLNRRLEVLKDLNRILMDAAHNHHATILEWIIIILIVVEVVIESFRGWREMDI